MAIGLIALVKILLAQFAGMTFLALASRRPFSALFQQRIALLVGCVFIVQAVAPNVWFIYFAVFLMMLIFGAKAEHAPGVFIFLFATIPSFPQQIMIGNVPFIVGTSQIFSSIAFGILAIFLGRTKYRFGKAFWYITLSISLFMVVIYSRGTSFTNFTREVLHIILAYVVPLWAMASLTSRIKDVRYLSVYILAAGVSLTTAVVFEAAGGWNFYRTIYEHVGIPPVWSGLKWRNGLLRATGPAFDATTMGLLLTLFAIFAWTSKGVLKSRPWSLAITALMGLGIYLTQSRNPIIGLAVGLVAWYLLQHGKKLGGWVVASSIGAASIAVVAVLASEPSTTNSPHSPDNTLEYRVRLLNRGIEEYKKHPFLGQSKADVDRRMEDLRQGEGIIDYVNSYLFSALLGGVAGLFVIISIFLVVPINIFEFLRKRNFHDPSGMGSFLFCTSVSIIQMSFFTWIFGIILPIYLVFQCIFVRIRARPAIYFKRDARRSLPGYSEV